MLRKLDWKTLVLALVILAFIGIAALALFRKPDAQSQSKEQREGPGILFPVVRDHKTGYIDKTGKIVIEPQFKGYAGEFSEGLALISIDTDGVSHYMKFGFIDTTGKIVIQPHFDEVRHFSDGLALVSVGRSHGYIDKTGRAVIEPRLDFQD